MNRSVKGIDQVVKLNSRQLVIFEVLFRLVTGVFYIRLVNQLLRSLLRMIGCSYLTTNNIGAFLLRPATIACTLATAVLGMVLVIVGVGGLITAYQSAAYSMRVDPVYILRDALGKAWDMCKGRNWRSLSPALADYLIMNSYLLLQILTRIRPLNFAIYEILHAPAARLGLILLAAALVLIGVPTMLVFPAYMIEQEQFDDGFRKSMELLKERSPRAVVPLVVVDLGLTVGLALVYVVVVVISAVIVTLFVDSYVAMAVLSAACARLGLIALFTGGALVPLVSFGVLAVIYYQYGMKGAHEAPWDFTMLYELRSKRKWISTVTGALAGTSLFFAFDMVCNGTSSGWDVLRQTEVMAHRGSSRTAPENTMAVIKTAMEEMVDHSEINVRITADGIVMVYHDLNLKRVAGVDRRLGAMIYDQVSGLDVGSRLSPKSAGERIPTLEEVLEARKGHVKLNIELKNIGNDSSLPEQVAALVREYGVEEQHVITSAKLEYLERVKEMAPELRTGYTLAAAYGMYYSNEYIDFISIRSSFVGRKLVEAAHERGKAVHVWTVNSKTEIERVKLLGVDNVTMDYPVQAREILYREETTEIPMEYLKMMLR